MVGGQGKVKKLGENQTDGYFLQLIWERTERLRSRESFLCFSGITILPYLS